MAGPASSSRPTFGRADAAWARTEAQAASLQDVRGPRARGGALGSDSPGSRRDRRTMPGEHHLGRVIDRGDRRRGLGRLRAARRVRAECLAADDAGRGAEPQHAAVTPRCRFITMTVDPTHPLLVDCFAGQILQALAERGVAPQQAGLLLVADGQGDPATRADSYRLMRLLWEQAGLGQAEVGFVRHAQPFLRGRPGALPARAARLAPAAAVPVGRRVVRLRRGHARRSPAGAPRGDGLAAARPAAGSPGDSRLARTAIAPPLAGEACPPGGAAFPPPNTRPPPTAAEVWSGEDWVPAATRPSAPRPELLARARESGPLAEILARVLPRAERYLVKVTWHGYAPGDLHGPGGAGPPARRTARHGRSCWRGTRAAGIVGGADIDWETDAAQHRTWIRQQDVEFLRRTGLAEVIARHGAQYLNVTEAWWDGACAPAEDVRAALGDVTLQNPELAGFVPSVLMELRGTPLISFARFKGPTRLGISNLFGLIPHPLRTAWHGPNITDFASVCCDLARLYGCLFPLFGFVEAFDSAVRWDRKGLYRSRWGNYDLVLTDGLFTLSEGLVGADLLASRLQGQDVLRSGFYDVVRDRLGWSPAAATAPLPVDLQATLA